MPKYGILDTSLDSNSLTGADSELINVFSAPLNILSNKPEFVTDALNLRRNAFWTGAQRWEITAGIVPEETPQEFLIHSVVMGHTTPFYIRMPQLYRRGANVFQDGLAVETTNSISAGGDTIHLDGISWGSLEMPIGEFIKFNNHSKVYLVIDSWTQASENYIKVFPNLVAAVGITTSVYYGARVALRVRYDTETDLGVKYTDGVMTEIMQVKLIEAL